MRCYARQMNPEYQEPYLFIDGVENTMKDIYPGITLTGNKDFDCYETDDFNHVIKLIDNDYISELLNDHVWFKATKFFDSYIPKTNGGKYTHDEAKRLVKLCEDIDFHHEDDTYCAVLSIVTGKTYDHTTLRGCCQRDWIECYYPTEDYSHKELEILESEYFNMGSEWEIHDKENEPTCAEDVSGYSIYFPLVCGENEVKTEIAKEVGCEPSDVVLYVYDGEYRAVKYREA